MNGVTKERTELFIHVSVTLKSHYDVFLFVDGGSDDRQVRSAE